MKKKHGEINAAVLFEQTGWLQALARSLVEDSHRAEDLIQDTLLTAVGRPPLKAMEGSALRAWLARVVRNLAFSSARGERHRAAREEAAARSEQLPSVAEAVERTELRQRLMDAILGLDAPYRDVVILRYLEGLSTGKVAERTGASAPAVRTRLSRGLGMLRARLDEEYGGERRAWMAIVMPLAREGERLAAAGVPTGSGFLVAKVIGALVAAGAVAVVAWAGLARLGSTGSESASVPGVEVASVETASGSEPREPAEAGAPQVGNAKPGLAREPVRLPAQDQPLRIEMRAELHSGDSDLDKAARYRLDSREYVLGPPRFFALEAARRSEDRLGFAAVAIHLAEEDRLAFASWTAEIVSRRMAVLLDGAVISVADVETPLVSGTLVLNPTVGGYSEEDIPDILARLGFPPQRFEPYMFYGVVVNASEGAPIENPLLLVEDEFAAPRVLENGLFLVQVENRELEAVRVEAEGYAPATVVLSRNHGAPASAQLVDLVRTASLEIQVVDADGAPVSGAFIRLSSDHGGNVMRPRWSPGRPGVAFPPWECTTTEGGVVRQEELAPEVPIILELYRSREEGRKRESPLRWKEVVLSPGERRSIELAIPTRRSLRGRVIGPRGEALSGVEVQLVRNPWESQVPRPLSVDRSTSSSVTSAVDGRFLFDDVPEGPCHVGVALESRVIDAEGAPLAMLSVPLVLDEVSSSREVILEMVPALSLGGVVVDAEGEAVEGLGVLVWAEAGSWCDSADTDENGEFQFARLPPGRYALATSFARFLSRGARFADAGEPQVRLLHVPCTVRVALSGVPHLRDLGVEATLYPASAEDPSGGPFELIGEGQLQCEDFPPGTYNLVVRSRDGRVAIAAGIELGIETRRLDLLLELSPGVPLEIRVDSQSDARWYEVHLDRALIASGRVREGVPDVQLVRAGSLRVRLLDESGSVIATKQIVAVDGREARVVFGGR